MDTYPALVERIRRALLERRMVVPLGQFLIRYLRRDEEFTDEQGNELQALQSGVFIRLISFREGGPARGHWVHFGSCEDLYDRLRPYVDSLKSDELGHLMFSLSANAALHSLRPNRATSANDEPVEHERMRG